MKASVIYNGKILAAVIDGKQYSIDNTHPTWSQAISAYKAKNYKKLVEAMNLPEAIVRYTLGKVKVCNGGVFYDNAPVHGTITARILQFLNEDFPFVPLVRFLNNLYKNPSADTRAELYDFLEKGKMPITDDGCFLAYKKIGPDMRSLHANDDGSFNKHSLNKVIKMRREDCDPNRHATCSRGLHFCSFDYLHGYAGTEGYVVIMKVNPKDVTAIPSDHNDTKGRCCEYVTVAIAGKLLSGNLLTGKLYSSKAGRIKAYNPKREKKPQYHSKRDKSGRFAPARR